MFGSPPTSPQSTSDDVEQASPGGTELGAAQLQSKEHRELLDAVDRLRNHHIDESIRLPQIIVCGDQSSGKSSVLGAISRVRFPAVDGFCTYFATELVLRRAPEARICAEIVPWHERSEEDQTYLRAFKAPTSTGTASDFQSIYAAAQKHMSRFERQSGFLFDRLKIEISSEDQPDLTLVDLPGFIHSHDSDHTPADVDRVRDLVKRYMRNNKAIILAVLDAYNQVANQVVISLATEFDPSGQRTLGVITKPDLLKSGSSREKAAIALAKNHNVVLRLGWHVVVNWDSDRGEYTDEQRNRNEHDCLMKGAWLVVPEAEKGVSTLIHRLHSILLKRITSDLPELIRKLEAYSQDCIEKLEGLGEPRETEAKQRAYLNLIASKMHRLVEAGLSGAYSSDRFFVEDGSDRKSRRIRTVLRKAGHGFANKIRTRGHQHAILEAKQSKSNKVAGPKMPPTFAIARNGDGYTYGGPAKIYVGDYVAAIAQYIEDSSGHELPSNPPGTVASDVFRYHAAPWQQLGLDHLTALRQQVQQFFDIVVSRIAPEEVQDAILQHLVDPEFEKLEETLMFKLKELVKPYQDYHPKTFNPAFGAKVSQKLDQLDAPEQASDDENKPSKKSNSLDVAAAKKVYCDVMAYYEIALDTFIDNIGLLAVECCLVDSVRNLLSPERLAALEPDVVKMIAEESDEVRRKRLNTQERLNALKEVEQVFKRHARHLPRGGSRSDFGC